MAGRRLQIAHRTAYRYTAPVTASFNEVRMTPADCDGQVLLAHSLAVHPAAIVTPYTDYWGAVVEAFDVHEPHEELEVVAHATVDTPPAQAEPVGVAWQDVRAGGAADRWGEFLAVSGYVDDARGDPARAPLLERLGGAPTPLDAVHAAVDAVHAHLAYTPGATSVSTTAAEAWAVGRGVCQDFTHATLSLLRAVGIPARYVSGYLHSEAEALGEHVRGESHAWAEAWLGGWYGFDPTNARTVGAAHVVVARGRDYADVPPFKGIFAGGGTGDLTVLVDMVQLAR